MRAKSRITRRVPGGGPAVWFTMLLLLGGGMFLGCEATEAPPEDDAEEQALELDGDGDNGSPEPEPEPEEPDNGEADEAFADERVTLVDVAALTQVVEDADGTVTVINFWATWCPPCLNEMPYLVEFYETYADADVTFISVTADAPRTIDDVLEYMTDEDIPFHVYVMDGIQPPDVAEALDIDFRGALPVTVIFDQEGDLVVQWDEEITLADLQEAVDPLLGAT